MDKEKEDRISLLPDCLLLEIISRLEFSTKEVIKTTSTISKRWQHLWTLLPSLVIIDEDDVTGDTDLIDYFSFIDKTLSQCPTNVNLKNFKLLIMYNSKITTLLTLHVNIWIRHAITRNVQEVDLLILDEARFLERFSYDDELFFNNSCLTSMKLSYCLFNPPNGVIRWDKLKCLCINYGRLDEDSVGKILSGSPCLETLQLKYCHGFRRIDVTSESVKNLVLYGYGYKNLVTGCYYIDTLEINAPYILSLTLTGPLYLEKILLLNVSSLVKAELSYWGRRHFAEDLGRDQDDIQEELLRGLLPTLDHVNDIALMSYCLQALSRLEATGFQFRKGSDRRGIYPRSYRVFSLIHK